MARKFLIKETVQIFCGSEGLKIINHEKKERKKKVTKMNKQRNFFELCTDLILKSDEDNPNSALTT